MATESMTDAVGQCGVLVHNTCDKTGTRTTGAASDEIKALGELQGKTDAEIAAQLSAEGYSSVPANSDCTVWTKAGTDGSTAAVRIDPAKLKANPKGWADEVLRVHKEIVPTSYVQSGNFKPSSATTLNDQGVPTVDKGQSHVPIK